MSQFAIPFEEAVQRLCTNCGWALLTDSPVLPLGAAVIDVDSLSIWLDRDPDDEDCIKVEGDAIVALSPGDYPHRTHDVGDGEGREAHDVLDGRWILSRTVRRSPEASPLR